MREVMERWGTVVELSSPQQALCTGLPVLPKMQAKFGLLFCTSMNLG